MHMNRTLSSAAIIIAASAASAQNQALQSTDTNVAQVNILGGGAVASGGGDRDDVLRTNPDVSVSAPFPSSRSCRGGDTSVGLGSFLFGGGAVSTTSLDEGCEARADSAHLAALAEHRVDTFGDYAGGLYISDLAVTRMFMEREQWEELHGAMLAEWSEFDSFSDPGAVY
jgi:hypothetical protein